MAKNAQNYQIFYFILLFLNYILFIWTTAIKTSCIYFMIILFRIDIIHLDGQSDPKIRYFKSDSLADNHHCLFLHSCYGSDEIFREYKVLKAIFIQLFIVNLL